MEEATSQIAILNHDLEGDSTAASSESENDDQLQRLFFSLEEIEMMENDDKIIYMNKLLVDHQIIQDYITQVIEKVKQARVDIKESIARGEETIAAAKDYLESYDNLFVNLLGKMADPNDEPVGNCRIGPNSVQSLQK